MNPKDLTVDQVASELRQLINTFPTRTGSVNVGDPEDYGCVYYLDENDYPISHSEYDFNDRVSTLTTPVCIVGQWIEDFHPEFKDNDVVYDILARNAVMATVDPNPFSEGVKTLLAEVQGDQDRPGSNWSEINFEQAIEYARSKENKWLLF